MNKLSSTINRLFLLIFILFLSDLLFSQEKQSSYFVLNNNKGVDTLYWNSTDISYIIDHFGETEKKITYSNIPNRKEGKIIKNVELLYSDLGVTFYLRSNPNYSKSKAKQSKAMLDELILASNQLLCLNGSICIGQSKEKIENVIGKGIESIVNGIQNNASVRYLELGLEIEYEKNKNSSYVVKEIIIYNPARP